MALARMTIFPKAFFITGIFTVGLILGVMNVWKQNPQFYNNQQMVPFPARARPSTDYFTGQQENQEEKEEPVLEELLQILQHRFQNYTGRKLDWRRNICIANANNSRPCYDPTCPRQFPSSLKQRLQQMLSARATIPARYLQALASAARPVTSHKYIFATGASSNHFKEMQALLDNLFKYVFPRMKGEDYAFVVYNLGLTPQEKKLTEMNCRCTVIDFPFDGLPDSAGQLKCFTWKSMIVASLLEKTEYLVWMDTSIRWKNSTPLADMFSQVRANSYLARRSRASISVHTQESTARFYGDHLCQYTSFPEMSAGFGFYYNDRIMTEVILPLWLSCAFTPDCMCVEKYIKLHTCRRTTRAKVTCHRFDQSSLSMILAKLFLENRPMVYMPGGAAATARGHKMDWFESEST